MPVDKGKLGGRFKLSSNETRGRSCSRLALSKPRIACEPSAHDSAVERDDVAVVRHGKSVAIAGALSGMDEGFAGLQLVSDLQLSAVRAVDRIETAIAKSLSGCRCDLGRALPSLHALLAQAT